MTAATSTVELARRYRPLVGWCATVNWWGSTLAERTVEYPCDGLIAHPDTVLFRAVGIEAPSDHVYRWLCQLRVAPYSYDWIDNFGRRSPRQLVPGLEQLEVGQRFMTIFELVAFEPGRSITIESTTRQFGLVVVSYVVLSDGRARTRLVVKLAVRAPRGVHGVVVRRLLPAGDLVMMRKQLLNLKHLAEDRPATGDLVGSGGVERRDGVGA